MVFRPGRSPTKRLIPIYALPTRNKRPTAWSTFLSWCCSRHLGRGLLLIPCVSRSTTKESMVLLAFDTLFSCQGAHGSRHTLDGLSPIRLRREPSDPYGSGLATGRLVGLSAVPSLRLPLVRFRRPVPSAPVRCVRTPSMCEHDTLPDPLSRCQIRAHPTLPGSPVAYHQEVGRGVVRASHVPQRGPRDCSEVYPGGGRLHPPSGTVTHPTAKRIAPRCLLTAG